MTIPSSSFIISVASGKGGVGKSVATVNLAETLNRQGYRVAVVDADLGLSNCATLLNEAIPATALDLLNETCFIEDVIHTAESGITMVTGADEPDAHLQDWSILYLVLDEILRTLRTDHDFILVDTPAGASGLSLWSLDRSDLCILLLVDEPTVIADLYRFCKYIMQIDPAFPFAAIVNFSENESGARDILNRFNNILDHFLGRKVHYLGFIPASDLIRESVRRQVPAVLSQPDTDVEREFSYIARTLQHAARMGNHVFTELSASADVKHSIEE